MCAFEPAAACRDRSDISSVGTLPPICKKRKKSQKKCQKKCQKKSQKKSSIQSHTSYHSISSMIIIRYDMCIVNIESHRRPTVRHSVLHLGLDICGVHHHIYDIICSLLIMSDMIWGYIGYPHIGVKRRPYMHQCIFLHIIIIVSDMTP